MRIVFATSEANPYIKSVTPKLLIEAALLDQKNL